MANTTTRAKRPAVEPDPCRALVFDIAEHQGSVGAPRSKAGQRLYAEALALLDDPRASDQEFAALLWDMREHIEAHLAAGERFGPIAEALYDRIRMMLGGAADNG